jgi:hypothetical protein
MANPAPKTKDWHAWQDLQPGPAKPRLHVVGQVQKSSTNQTPKLSEHVPQGINPKILQLDLTLAASGQGDALMSWQEVRFFKSIERDQYSNVEIFWDGKRIESLEVKDVE